MRLCSHPPVGKDEPVGSTPDVRGNPASLTSRAAHLILGPHRVRPLAIAHALAAGGDAFVTVSLAGSLFFNVSPDASREQVLLYLVVTMSPLAVLAPLIGPTVDRFHRRPHLVVAACYALRALFCLVLATTLYQLSFFAVALALLIVGKATNIARQALVPALVDIPEHLVSSNARLARLASVTAGAAAGAATAVLNTSGAEWVLRCAAVVFVCASLVMTRARPRSITREIPADLEYAELHLPTVVVSSIGFMAIRAAVGFFVLATAFSLRRASEPAWFYGAVVVVYGAGGFLGNVIAPFLRRRFPEERLIALGMVAPATLSLVGVLGVARGLLLAIALVIGLSTTIGNHAFDSLLQQRAPAPLLGRAGARYETRFQLAWVFGGLLATPISLPAELSMGVLASIYIPTLVLFVRASRQVRHFEASVTDTLPVAMARLASADQARRNGAPRAAIVDAAAAVDLAQIVDHAIAERDGRSALDELRMRAVQPDGELADDDAERAIRLAYRLINPQLPSPR